ncbi:S41 family peptidase [Acidiphilium sp. PA]|uniref:S41 family peptidase n=1 Tax=Acidiphilium sp. PA TaxID=2871705 RepID=UPI0022431B4F|nr:S41 family peptidase [Acidiphilium sp. PA]MCW8305497.1 S41 family peptidase [Acidiphilium sp. PA]
MSKRKARSFWRAVSLLCVVLPLCGAYAAAPAFDQARAGAVWGAALAFIAPRTLEPLSIPQMAVWGLSGITALDPDLTVQKQAGKLLLYGPNRVLFAANAPPPADAAAWGDACAAVAAHAFTASPALARAGTEGVIRSFFDELFNHFDPYSRYEAPHEAAEDRAMRLGHAGLGLTLGRQGSAILIARVAPSGPADQAGMAPGMAVLAIDGQTTAGQHLAALQGRLTGKLGSTIRITVRPPKSLPQTIRLTRGLVPIQSVFGAMDNGIAVIRVIGFDHDTGEQFAAALGALVSATPEPKGIVIDLRGNRGGVLRQSVLSIDTLLSHGTIIRTIGRDPAADKLFHAEGADLARGLPVIILVDGATASAAEVFSAALADNDRAVVVGSATLGKGLVQSLTTLPGGGELYVTWSRMIAPRGWPLQGLGVFPQVCVSLGTNVLDQQLATLQAGDNMLAKPLAETRAARAPIPLAEILALRDSCPAAVGANGYFAAATALIDDPVAYHAALVRPLLAASGTPPPSPSAHGT